MKLATCLAVALVAVLVPAAAAAQEDPDSIRLRNDCRLAAQIIARGHPEPHEAWAWDVIHRCGSEGGVALAAGLRALRQSSDTALLDRLTTKGRWLRDGAFFSAAVDVSGDRSATVPARLFSMIVLLYAERLERPTSNGLPIHYRDLLSPVDPTTGFPTGSCGLDRYSFSTRNLMPSAGAPLPADYRRQIVELGGRLFRDSTEAQEVRVAAFCLL
jgi:hypothetical protein